METLRHLNGKELEDLINLALTNEPFWEKFNSFEIYMESRASGYSDVSQDEVLIPIEYDQFELTRKMLIENAIDCNDWVYQSYVIKLREIARKQLGFKV